MFQKCEKLYTNFVDNLVGKPFINQKNGLATIMLLSCLRINQIKFNKINILFFIKIFGCLKIKFPSKTKCCKGVYKFLLTAEKLLNYCQ
ncbi:hypothetical protein C7N83_05530 [Neisseria iguanae]|uniref:Uncharacterized protein n=1 Tax=Neisseria iguanae TaxID=90242 RepID=A0A2P7U101_9NEIS|nr:hypothetical protein C7N83_05530 [Neisseria iguanae]